MGSCTCLSGQGDQSQFVFDEAIKLDILKSLKQKYSKENHSSIEQIPLETFSSMLNSTPSNSSVNIQDLLSKYTSSPTSPLQIPNQKLKTKETFSSSEYSPNSPPKDSYPIDPIKITFDQDGSTNFYHGCVNKQGDFNGQGILVIPNKYIFSGNFKNDEFNGKGLLIKKRGDYFYGDWKNGVCSGEGILVVNGQYEYNGQFKENKKNGYGVETYPDGTKYEGEFLNNKKNGKGKSILKNGEKYEGDYENDLYNGTGVYSWPEEGRKYQGEFKNGNMEGKGKNIFKDGSEYIGYYKGGLKNGEGVYSWPNGRKFKGNWVNGKLNGNGEYSIDNGREKYDITFRFGKIISTRNASNNDEGGNNNNDYTEDNNFNHNNTNGHRRVKFRINDVVNKEEVNDLEDCVCSICHCFVCNPNKCLSCMSNYCEDCVKDTNGEIKIKCQKCKGENFEQNLNLLYDLMHKIKFNCTNCNKVISYEESINHCH